ncbi:dTDP-4-dehydrorhamnose 3,5-epimerase [Roseateles puraquae]|jgi:dTDP-4-dehydrorhamnose 3,5-epimerase|uniref:dTDP-4-dehydrorhamnose 3,5-epimerase n=1 Tax=Roseateles puraquae TaxID=431059 RepID=UPI0031E44835
MKVTATALPEVLLIEPQVFGDARGFFMESWNEARFNAAVGHDVHFVQDNHSRSAKGVLRGLHYQLAPHAQGKLVRCVSGAVFDVAVDMRRSSPRFGRWVGFELSAENQRQMWIPPGFAHGFVVISDTADFLYKTSGRYAPECEGAVRWDDPTLGVAWPLGGEAAKLSAKDVAAPLLSDAKTFD